MVVEEFYIEAADGQKLYGKCWEPVEVDHVLLVLHDVSDHIGRFEELSNYFCNHNIAVVGIDQHGHGRSNGKRGHIRNYELVYSNIQELAIEARKRFNEQPLFIYGQGMGGNMAINYILGHTSNEFSGLILSSPWLDSNIDFSGIKKILYRIIRLISPSYSFELGIDPMDLSHDPDTGLNYMEDHLNHGVISIKLLHELSKGSIRAHEKIDDLKYPALLMHGDEDMICPVVVTKQLAKRTNGTADLKVWKGMRHELHNEKNNQEVFHYMLNWMHKKESK